MIHPAYIITFLGIFTAVSWGASDFLTAKSAKLFGPILSGLMVSFIGTLTCALLFLCYVLLTHRHFTYTLFTIGLAVLSGILFAVGEVSFNKALESDSVSIVSPLTSIYPLFTAVVTITIFHVHLTLIELLGICLVVAGVTVASGLFSMQRSNRESIKGPFYSILAALGWGLGYALLAHAFAKMGWQLATFISYLFLLISIFIVLSRIKGHELINRHTFGIAFHDKYVLSAGLIQLFGELALIVGISISISKGGMIVTALSSSYPALTIFLALKSFDENVRSVRVVGGLVGLFGIVLLTLPT